MMTQDDTVSATYPSTSMTAKNGLLCDRKKPAWEVEGFLDPDAENGRMSCSGTAGKECRSCLRRLGRTWRHGEVK